MTIVSRMLDRTPGKDHMLPEMKKWAANNGAPTSKTAAGP
mgnify:FL=1